LIQLAQRRLPALVRAGYYWADVRDVVQAAVSAETRGQRGQRYILAGEYATFKTIAQWIHQAVGAKPPRLNLPVWVARAAAPLVARFSRLFGGKPLITPETIQIITCHQKIETNKAAVELGFSPRPLEQTVKDSIHWLLEHAAKHPPARPAIVKSSGESLD
jgi:dihydroflavonol-4-reductase